MNVQIKSAECSLPQIVIYIYIYICCLDKMEGGSQVSSCFHQVLEVHTQKQPFLVAPN